jgi:hypothetical protein
MDYVLNVIACAPGVLARKFVRQSVRARHKHSQHSCLADLSLLADGTETQSNCHRIQTAGHLVDTATTLRARDNRIWEGSGRPCAGQNIETAWHEGSTVEGQTCLALEVTTGRGCVSAQPRAKVARTT